MTTVVRIVQTEKPIALVPLAQGSKGHAQIYLDDLENLLQRGLSPKWNRLESGYVTAPCSAAAGNNVQVARVLLDAGPNYRVKYNSYDRTDLRRENVLLVASYGSSRRDRDFLSGEDQLHRVVFQHAA